MKIADGLYSKPSLEDRIEEVQRVWDLLAKSTAKSTWDSPNTYYVSSGDFLVTGEKYPDGTIQVNSYILVASYDNCPEEEEEVK